MISRNMGFWVYCLHFVGQKQCIYSYHSQTSAAERGWKHGYNSSFIDCKSFSSVIVYFDSTRETKKEVKGKPEEVMKKKHQIFCHILSFFFVDFILDCFWKMWEINPHRYNCKHFCIRSLKKKAMFFVEIFSRNMSIWRTIVIWRDNISFNNR